MIARYLLFAVEDDAVKLGLEPLHGVLLGQSVGEPHTASLAAPVADIHAGSAHHHVKVHAIDTDAGVVPEKKIFSPDNVVVRDVSCYRIRRPAEFRDAELVL